MFTLRETAGLRKRNSTEGQSFSMLNVGSVEPRVNNDVRFSVGSHTKMHNKREKNDGYLKSD